MLFKKYMGLPVYLVDKAYDKYKELQEKVKKKNSNYLLILIEN